MASDLGDLYRRYHSPVLAMLWRMTRDRAVAEDLTGETFARAVAHAGETWDDPRAWLATVATNLVISRSRRHSTRREVLTDPASLPHQPDVDPEQVAMRRADAAAVRAAVRSLRPRQRECVVRRYWLDETEAATAQAMGIAQGTVKSATSRGVGNIAAMLRPARGEP